MHCYIVSTPEEYSWFSSLTMCLCYTLCLYSCKKIIEDYTNANTHMNTNTHTNTHMNKLNNINNINDIKYKPNVTLLSIKEAHNDKYKQNMFQELLDINSLERCYILYFIFKRKGDFKSLTSIDYINNELTSVLTNTYTNNNDNDNNNNNNINIEKENIIYEESDIETPDEKSDNDSTEEEPIEQPTKDDTPELKTYNSYELYNKIMNKLDLNLDETIIPDIQIHIGEHKYELTEEKLNFIQWLYYIGLYDYLTDINNIDIKYNILNEMNELGLLSGNVFLRYQLFLCDYEYETKFLSFTKT